MALATEYVAAAGGTLATRPGDAAARAGRWGRLAAPRALLHARDKTERRMALVQWLVMPLVLAGCLLPPPRPQEPRTHVLIAAAIMAMHPLLYVLLQSERVGANARPDRWRDSMLTAADITVATLVFYATAARPGYAQVLLYCAVALAATRYPSYRAFGITSLVALLLVFAALLPLHVAPPTLASEIMGLYALTYLIGQLSHAEHAVSYTARENARLAQTVLRRNRELGSLHGLARALNAEADVQKILERGLAGLSTALEVSGGRVYRRDGGELRLATELAGPRPCHEIVARHREYEARRALAAGHTVVKDLPGIDDDQASGAAHMLQASVPVLVHRQVEAVVQVELALDTLGPGAGERPLETLEVFCGELAVALENSMLRGEAHRTAILREKHRIAQELHDTVLQMLFSIGLRLQWGLEHLPADHPLRDALTEACHLSARAGSELRGAIFTLRSEVAEVGLVPAVEQLVSKQAAQAGWTANVLTSGDATALPVLVQNAAHRVVREALMNAYKHAKATEVVVSLRCAPTALTVVVQDNGGGIPVEALEAYRHLTNHFGLRTVAAQVEDLGGTFSAYNNDEQGAAIKAVIPLAA